jgi:hypothetical protein
MLVTAMLKTMTQPTISLNSNIPEEFIRDLIVFGILIIFVN